VLIFRFIEASKYTTCEIVRFFKVREAVHVVSIGL
jgi:hypothetical protein